MIFRKAASPMRNDVYTPDVSEEATAVAPLSMVSPESGPLGILRLPGVTNHQDSASMTSMGTEAAFSPSALTPPRGEDRNKVLPLPSWLRRLYFIFPVVLYVPDVIFNYYVYSDGVQPSGNLALQLPAYALWGFLSIGVVGMAYLLSVLAPWHWGQGHRIQAFFCGLGVVIATAITTWNSLAYRSEQFVSFRTDDWAYSLWPQLQARHISITMILVAMAPPFWGLFWALVQPTQTGRSLRQLQESHQERLLRTQQEAELKRLKAETNAKVREAQLRGMAATAATVRQQAAAVLSNQKAGLDRTATAERLHDARASEGVEAQETDLSTDSSPIPSSPTSLPAGEEREEVAAGDRSVGAQEREGPTAADSSRRRVAGQPPAAQRSRSAQAPLSPEDKRFPAYIYTQATQLLREGQALTLLALSSRVQQPVDVVQEAIRKLRDEHTAKLRPGQDLSGDPVLSNPNL